MPLIMSCQMNSSCVLEVTPSDNLSGHDHGSGEGDDVEPWMAAVATLLFCIMPVLAFITPFVVSRVVSDRTFAMLFSLGNCFSAGLILALGIMHIIPHTLEAQWAVGLDYPLNYLLITVGFFLTLFIEQVPGIHSNGGLLGDPDIPTSVNDHPKGSISGSMRANQAIPVNSVGAFCGNDDAHAKRPEEGNIGTNAEDGEAQTMAMQTPSSPSLTVMQRLNALMPALVFFVASQFHACLEAFFVGTTSPATDFWIFVGGVSTHKYFVALSFGLKVYALWGASDVTQRRSLALLSFLWAALPALCVVIGYVIASSISSMSQLILNSLAAGTFLYIGSFEILSEEFVHSHGPSTGHGPHQAFEDHACQGQSQWGSKPVHNYSKFAAISVAVAVVAVSSLIPHTH
uniref:Uncharacterized protein n=1 Tax=Tetraselmis chuii TaxID=63592 RepID=A0A7S1SUA2_9CHLO